MLKLFSKKSIGVKLSGIITVVLVLVLGIKTIYDSVNTYQTAVEANERIELEETRKLTLEAEEAFDIMYYVMSDLDVFLQETLKLPVEYRRRDVIIESLVKLAEDNLEIDGLGVFFEDNKFDNADAKYGRFLPYAKVVNGKAAVAMIDPTGEDWYEQPMQQKRQIILPPFEYEGELVSTMALPIIVGNEAVGVIAVDINLSNLQDRIEAIEGTDKENIKVIVADNGTIVANTLSRDFLAKDIVNDEPKQKEIISNAQKSKESVQDRHSAVVGKRAKIIGVPINLKGIPEKWVYLSINSFDSFTRSAKNSLILSIIINIATIFLIVGLIYVLIRNMISRPVSATQAAMTKMAKYRLNIEEEEKQTEKYRKRQDEIGEMVRSISAMAKNMKELLAAISSNTQTMAATAEELTATAENTESSAKEVAIAVNNIAEGASAQAEDTQSAAHSVEQANILLQEMASIIKELSEITNDIDQRKDEGNRAMRDLLTISKKNDAAG